MADADKCPACKGLGSWDVDQSAGGSHRFTCRVCKGTGRVAGISRGNGLTRIDDPGDGADTPNVVEG